MFLPRTAADFPLVIVDEVDSTNVEVTRNHASSADFTVVVTDNQTAGKGRLGRSWVAPAGRALAVSVLLRPTLPAGEPLALAHFGWLPLIAGVAMADAVDSVVREYVAGHRVGLKWPNDVQVDGAKISGILAELLPGGDAVVVGAGVNLSLTVAELPVPTATSLSIVGVPAGDEVTDLLLSRYLLRLRQLTADFLRLGADAAASGILALVTERCTTIGQEVRVELPGGGDLRGVATGIDLSGRLIVRRSSDGSDQAVAAGDVTHLRYE